MSDLLWASVSALVLGTIGVGVTYVKAYINSHFKPAQIGAVYDLARTAVAGAQQWGVGSSITGPDKLDFAVKALVTGAKKVGIKLTDEEASSFVHAALRELKQVQAFAMANTPEAA